MKANARATSLKRNRIWIENVKEKYACWQEAQHSQLFFHGTIF